MAEHKPTKKAPSLCWASTICGKPLGEPVLKGKHYEVRCGTKGHVCFFWNGDWHVSQRPVLKTIEAKIAKGAAVGDAIAPKIGASAGPASDAIAPTTDASAGSADDPSVPQVVAIAQVASGDGAMNIDASTGPASDAVTVKSEMDAADDYLYDVAGSEVGSDHHLNELINDLQADYIGDADWLPTGPSSEFGSDDPGADDSLPTGPTYGNLATRLPNVSQREFVFGSKGQFSQSCTFITMRLVMRHFTSSLEDVTEEELRFTYSESRNAMEWWCLHVFEYNPATGLSPWSDGGGLLVNPAETYNMDEAGRLDSELFVTIRELRKNYSIELLITDSPLMDLMCLIELDMKSEGSGHVCAYALVIDGYTFTVGKRGLRYQGLDSHGASSSVVFDGLIETFAQDMSQAVLFVRPDQPYNASSRGGCYKFSPRGTTGPVLFESAVVPMPVTPPCAPPLVSVQALSPLPVASATNQVDEPSAPFAGVGAVPGSGATPTIASPAPYTVPGSGVGVVPGSGATPTPAPPAPDAVPGSGAASGVVPGSGATPTPAPTHLWITGRTVVPQVARGIKRKISDTSSYCEFRSEHKGYVGWRCGKSCSYISWKTRADVMDVDENFPCVRCHVYLVKKRRLVEQLEQLEQLEPADPPPITAIVEDAESSLADTMVPFKRARFQADDEMIVADELAKSRERGIEAFLKEESVFEHLGGTSYRCKAK